MGLRSVAAIRSSASLATGDFVACQTSKNFRRQCAQHATSVMEAFAGTPGLVRPLSYNASRCRGISRKAHKLPQLPRRLLWRGAGPGADALTTRTNDPDANTKGEVFCVVAALTGFDRQMKNQMEMREAGLPPPSGLKSQRRR